MTNEKILLVVAGPTAVGKTALCVRLAQQLGTDVVSADSRQLYRQLSIGTAKPTPAEQQGVRHHLIDSHDVTEHVGAGRYAREARAVLDALFQEKRYVVLAGGTGLYINALLYGLDEMPPADATLRATLSARWQTEGLAPLVAELQTLDPAYATEADLQNPARVLRALEVCHASGQPYSAFRQQNRQRSINNALPFRPVLVALDRPREELYARIDARVDAMLAAGLLGEVETLRSYRHLNALQTVGYREVFGYFDGAYDYAEMVRLLKRNTRHYARRQLTWFRNQADYRWFSAEDEAGILAECVGLGA